MRSTRIYYVTVIGVPFAAVAAIGTLIAISSIFTGDRIDSFGWWMIGISLLISISVFSKTVGGILGTLLGSIVGTIWGFVKIAIILVAIAWIIYMLFSSSIAIAIVAGAALVAFAIWKSK